MPTAARAQLKYEGGQQSYAMHKLTDSGDHKTYTSSADHFSRRSGKTPVVRPNGLISGGAITPAAAGGNNNVDVAALVCNLNGTKTSVSADADVTITRPATDVAKVNSITINSGGTVAVVAGTDSADTSFSTTRGAAGGPPYIPVDSIEIGQVRVTASADAVIAESEIFTVLGLHVEHVNDPGYTIDYANAEVDFEAALPLIHTGDTTKAVHASYADPIFSTIGIASDFVPPENSYSVNSTQAYGRTIGSSSASLGQGSFTVYWEQDGIADPLVSLEGENLWFKFLPDRDTPENHILCQGILGFSRSYAPGDSMQAACTISAEDEAVNVVG